MQLIHEVRDAKIRSLEASGMQPEQAKQMVNESYISISSHRRTDTVYIHAEALPDLDAGMRTIRAELNPRGKYGLLGEARGLSR